MSEGSAQDDYWDDLRGDFGEDDSELLVSEIPKDLFSVFRGIAANSGLSAEQLLSGLIQSFTYAAAAPADDKRSLVVHPMSSDLADFEEVAKLKGMTPDTFARVLMEAVVAVYDLSPQDCKPSFANGLRP